MDEAGRYIRVEGTIASLVYQNPENGYAVVRLQTKDGAVTAVGCMPGITPGETLVLTGEWTVHQAYGERFKAVFVERRMPEGREAVLSYLSSGVIRNIGPAKAREIVDKFGERALDVIENEPEKLAQVRGISERRAREMSSELRRRAGLRRLLEFLSAYGIRPDVAIKLYKCFGDDALAAVKDNPYIMAEEQFGAEFFEADSAAIALGFEADCPERVEAAVIFELSHNLGNGHTFLPLEKLVDATHQLIGVERETIVEALEALVESGYIVREEVAGKDACYLREYHEAERCVARRIKELASRGAGQEDLSGLVAEVEREAGVKFSNKQLEAIELAAKSRVMALTGGPGTGKTTSVRGIIRLFDMLGLKTALCAPTGRAAKRMGELTGREAATIHRLLGAGIGEGGEIVFEHDETNPLDADAVVVDEMSMVDVSLMHSLLSAMREGCRLVMVGDSDQLPPVGPGNVFSDVIRSGVVPTVVLDEIFRQAAESGIVRNAHLINRGVIPDLAEKSGDFFFLKRLSPERVAETVVELCAERLPKNMGIPPQQIQVLSPTRKNVAGTEELNLRLQAALNPMSPGKREKAFGERVFREGDKVMQIRNNYDIMWKSSSGLASGLGVFNGDIGVVKEIDLAGETLTVEYEDKLVKYLFEQISELEMAYALTVHKSQGSEYQAVVLALPPGASQLLVRSVLYTAVTRARQLLVIVGDPDVLRTMVQNDRRQRRYSGLRFRLAEAGEPEDEIVS